MWLIPRNPFSRCLTVIWRIYLILTIWFWRLLDHLRVSLATWSITSLLCCGSHGRDYFTSCHYCCAYPSVRSPWTGKDFGWRAKKTLLRMVCGALLASSYFQGLVWTQFQLLLRVHRLGQHLTLFSAWPCLHKSLLFVYISGWALVYFRLHLLQVGVLYVCFGVSILDCNGDHVLGCHNGSTRIKRHDALCNIIFHCLQANNSGTRRKQRCCSDNQSRPGDIFHPDFLRGRLAYFDLC